MKQQINHQMLLNFIQNEVSKEQHKRILNEIENDEIIRGWYLQEKRRIDVERYLYNKMSVGEKIEFEELLKKDTELKKYFNLSKDINSALESETFRKQLDRIHEELYGSNNEAIDMIREGYDSDKNSVTTKKPLNYKIIKTGKWVAAASIMLLIIFSGKIYISKQNSIENRLYVKNYELFLNNTKTYFNSSSILKAKNLYSVSKSGDALSILQDIPNSIDIEPEKNLYSGLAFMELKRYNEAIEKFKALQNDDEMTVFSISQWYLALSYLATEKRYEAIPILEEIVENKSYNHDKAKNILKELSF